jgi:hypothetical protein
MEERERSSGQGSVFLTEDEWQSLAGEPLLVARGPEVLPHRNADVCAEVVLLVWVGALEIRMGK